LDTQVRDQAAQVRAVGSHLRAAGSHLLDLGAPLSSLLSRNWTTAWVLYSIAFLIPTAPVWSGSGFPIWDANSQFAPTHMLLGDFLTSGRLFLWNPWINAGSPDFADPDLGVFSPISCLFAWIGHGTLVGYRLQWLLLWFLPGAGLLLLARHLGAKPWAAMVVASGFAFSGFFTGHSEHFPQFSTLAWVPLILWRLDVALIRGRWWPAIEAGALWGLSGVGGYPALALGSATFLVFWAVGRALFSEEARAGLPARVGHAVALLALLFATGLLVLGPNYLVFLSEVRGFSDRAGYLTRDFAFSNALPAGALATLASPFLHMQKLLGWQDLWTLGDVSSICLYLGAASLVLAVAALAWGRREPFRWWLLGMVLLSLSYTLARDLPVRGWAYDYLPPTRFFRHPAFFRCFPMLGLAALALLGTRDLPQGEDVRGQARWRSLAVMASALGTAALVTFFCLARLGGKVLRLGTAHALLVWIGLAVLLWACAFRPRTRAWAAPVLVVLAGMDAAMTVTITERHVFETGSFQQKMWAQLAELHERSMNLANHLARGYKRPLDVDVPWFDTDIKTAVLKRPILDGYTALTNNLWTDFVGTPALRGIAEGPDRFYFSPDAPLVAPTHAAYEAFKERGRDPRSPPIFLHARADMRTVDRYQPYPALDGPAAQIVHASPAAVPTPVRIVRYRPEELQLEVETPSPGWLLVTDRWAQGWEATVNGRPAEIMGADFFFRAVHVDQGRNEVRMVYRPLGMPWLLFLGWATLVAVLVGSLALGCRKRRQAGVPPTDEVKRVLEANEG
jgi:hypothetical protein